MEANLLQEHLSRLMTKGFERAACSFAGFINKKISLAQSHVTIVKRNEELPYYSSHVGTLSVLSTELIGDLSGRSLLIINDRESVEIARAVSPDRPLSQQLKEALLLEIDNIISAAVIAQLANTMQIEIYGDVPSLQQVDADDVQDYLQQKIHDATRDTCTVVCKTSFLVNESEHIHPQFIWKLDAKILDMVRDLYTTV